MLLSAIFAQHVDIRGYQLITLGESLHLEDVEVLVFLCHEFHEVSVVQAVGIISAHFLKTEERGVTLVHVEIGLGVEIGIGLVGRVRTLLVSAKQSAGHAVDAGVQRAVSVVGVLCRGHVVCAHGSLCLVHQFHGCTVVCTSAVRIVHLDGKSLYPKTSVYHLD